MNKKDKIRLKRFFGYLIDKEKRELYPLKNMVFDIETRFKKEFPEIYEETNN